ncbi:Uncharacterised protein [Mycobacteroides abscessus subsp. massiliense]|nr:Uncharacterised protein [Mycobacteroides abscessus subsp. massiliense]
MNFQCTVQKQIVFVKRDFVFQADAPRRIRRCLCIGTFGLQQRQHFIAFAFQGIDTDVERGRLVDAAAEGEDFFFAPMLLQLFYQPLRQFCGGIQAV